MNTARRCPKAGGIGEQETPGWVPRRGRLIQVLPLGSRYSYQRPRPVFIGCRARLRRVVDEIIGKKLLEQAPVAFALYFLGVPSNYGNRRVAD